ncbi:hypothetical protein BG0451 [Borreliella bavariensis PBi]|uniref:Uncharacterized protein n=1 Tax=Borrelia garinii subsp. bavariensis (strain ATCC BAA-2496 / DSM 23469 / PBi) TaxID=290434 RepID=A0A7I6GWB9_BORGP|nr:hypothetical protein BG0451 [Borreliella bavariensis PBi]
MSEIIGLVTIILAVIKKKILVLKNKLMALVCIEF